MSEAGWVKAAAAADVVADEPLGITVEGRPIALYRVGDEVFATANRCTHGDAVLSEGFQMDHCIECPLHQGQFDIRTGEPLCAPVTEPIRVYPVRLDGDDVLIQLTGE